MTSSVHHSNLNGTEFLELECRGVLVKKRLPDAFINISQLLFACPLSSEEKSFVFRHVSTLAHVQVDHNNDLWAPEDIASDIARQYGIEKELAPLFFNYNGYSGLPERPLSSTTSSNPAIYYTSYNVPKLEERSSSVNSNSPPSLTQGGPNLSYISPPMQSASSHPSAYNNQSHTFPNHSNTGNYILGKRGHSPEMNELSQNNGYHSSPSTKKRVLPAMSDVYQTMKKRYLRKGNLFNGTESQTSLPFNNDYGSLQTMKPSSPRLRKTTLLSSSNYNGHHHHETSDLLDFSLNQNSPLSPQQKQILLNIFVDDSLEGVTKLFGKTDDINMVLDDQGNTCVHWAAALGRVRVLKHLLMHGADPQQFNFNGETPLFRAIQMNYNRYNHSFPELLHLLQDGLYTVDQKRQSILHHLAHRTVFDKETALYYLNCIRTHMDLPRNRLKRHIFLNAKDRTGDTVLHIASRLGNLDALKLFLAMGADATIKNLAGKLPSECAIPNSSTHKFFFNEAYISRRKNTSHDESEDDTISIDSLESAATDIAYFLAYVKRNNAVLA